MFFRPHKRLQALELGTKERLGHADSVETVFQEKLQRRRGRQGKPAKCGSGGDLPHKQQAER